MDDQAMIYRRLLRHTVAALLVAGMLVTLCYFFVDRSVARFVHEHKVPDPVLKALTEPPPILQAWTPAMLAVLLVRRCWGPLRRWEWVVLAAAVAIVLADQARESLSFLFGRYWPETWTNNNPSLIGNNEYGFHPFHEGSWYGSFPSGHTARMAALAGVIWYAWPKWGWISVLAVLPVVIGLIGMNYHFVGDVVGGSFVGGIVGVYTCRVCLPADAHSPRAPVRCTL